MSGMDTSVYKALVLTCLLPVVRAQESTAIVVTSVVAGLLLLVLFAGLVIFCFYKNGVFKKKSNDNRKGKKTKKKKKHRVKQPYINGGYQGPMYAPYDMAYAPHPPPQLPPQMVHHLQYAPPKYEVRQNGYVQHGGKTVREATRGPRVAYPHATYHGRPPGFEEPIQAPLKSGTFNGAPPTVIKIGSVHMRPDPRPVIQVSRRNSRDPFTKEEDVKRTKHKEKHRKEPQEFVIQPSYDGIPVIRPVIYIDDDQDDRDRRHERRSRSRSKSREPRQHKERQTSSDAPRVTEVRMERPPPPIPVRQPSPVPVVPQTHRAPTRSRTPSPVPVPMTRSPLVRSRASSVTEAVNALRMSVKDHTGDGMSDTTSHSSRAPSFGWTQGERAPDPAAGDVMFFPAGQDVVTERHTQPHVTQKPEDERVYGYTRVIKSSTVEPPRTRQSVKLQETGYEVPASLSRTVPGTRDQQPRYETEHGRTSGVYGSNLGATMSDRLTNLVEDGDKTRYSHYNIGAINLGKESDEEEEAAEEPVQMRVKRPDTPPDDIPRNSGIYSDIRRSERRPPTPPNDIPLITPRESTEIPPLNFGSMVNSPRPITPPPRPNTPPPDFPITPKSSFIRNRPATPPFDVETSRSNVGDSAPNLSETTRSLAADPATGEPGSFQARQRLIEAHLQRNAAPEPVRKSPAVSKWADPTSPAAPPPPPPPQVVVTPGVIPPPPPPPPPGLFK